MPDNFDPYREALVMETETLWPDDLESLPPAQKIRIEDALHAQPDQAAHLVYVRTHTGFCRQITVTPEDVARVGG